MNKNFGLTDSQLSLIKELVTELLSQAVTYKVFVFGSRAHGTEKKYSDIDLWIESAPDVSQQQLTNFLEKVETSDLPIKVDVLTASNCLDAYRDRILNERVEWFGK